MIFSKKNNPFLFFDRFFRTVSEVVEKQHEFQSTFILAILVTTEILFGNNFSAPGALGCYLHERLSCSCMH